MLKKFFEFNKKNALLNRETKFIVTVSGGLDSMVLLDLCYKAGFDFSIAHCNFKLRGEESDMDAEFVKNIAQNLDLEYFEKSFDTKNHADHNKISIQESARILRYEWFEELLANGKFMYYATAHHFDDKIETFFINLFRGTGIAGLRSIQPKNGNCVRPLLFATRAEAENYALKNHIPHREDSSNQEDHYTRNKIRHFVLPVIEKTYPEFRKGFENTFHALTLSEAFIREETGKIATEIVGKMGDKISIDLNSLKEKSHIELLLFEVLKNYGFNPPTIHEIYRSVNGISGKKFFSETHTLTKERNSLIIASRENSSGIEMDEIQLIEPYLTQIDEPVRLSFETEILTQDFEIQKDRNTALLDYDKLNFPLLLRKPVRGDSFSPLGMRGRKKISDYFIDAKFTDEQKQQTYLIVSDNQIAWLIGERIDNRFKITPETRTVFKIIFHP